MSFAQICGALGGYSLNWPEKVAGFLDILGILDFDGAQRCAHQRAVRCAA